jgi:hypothetical protein
LISVENGNYLETCRESKFQETALFMGVKKGFKELLKVSSKSIFYLNNINNKNIYDYINNDIEDKIENKSEIENKNEENKDKIDIKEEKFQSLFQLGNFLSLK